MIWVQRLIDAIAIGALFALVALGIGLVFGVMRLVNLAYGELMMAGGYALFATASWPVLVRIPVALAVVIVLSLVLERVVFRRLRGAAPATMLAVTFGVSFLLRSIAQKRWSAQGKAMAVFTELNQTFTIGSLRIKWLTIVAILVSAALLSAVHQFLTRTDLGLQMRAASSDARTARALGIRTDRVIVAAFVIAAVLATAALLLFAPQRPVVTPDYGLQISILALVGVVIGGMDRIGPATLGGFAVGFANSMLFSLLPKGQRIFLDTALYGLVIVVLLARPSGLFQRDRQAVRV